MPQAVSPKQLKFLRDLIEKKDLARDAVIYEEVLFFAFDGVHRVEAD